MKGLEAQNHYEVLELAPGARREEIERAYRLATETWAEGSLALYSIFDDADAAIMRERVQHAYRVLSDDASRRAYDDETFDSAAEPELEPSAQTGELESVEEDYEDIEISLEGALEANSGVRSETGEVDYSGARLRRSRMDRGFEIEQISQITKIAGSYLHAIEEEAFDSLPAEVYVRGFVTAYARTIGMDWTRVATSYMVRFQAAHQGRTRGRLLARRGSD